MFHLDGKIALITGSTGGIGQAIAQTLHRQGATVVLTGRRKEPLEALVETLGERAHYVAADLAQEGQVDELLKQVADCAGTPDILVNNAGLTHDTMCMRMKDSDWNAVLDVDLTVPFKLARGVLKGMLRKRFGRIINISSVVGVTGNPGQANYCAAKAGLVGMSKALAREVGKRGITVNAVSPGFVTTPMTAALPQTHKDALLAQIPVGRFGQPQDIASMVTFLASEEASWITGANMNVNGGMMMG